MVAEDAADESALPELPRSLLVAIAQWMRADQGHWRLAFEFQDGHLRRWFRHEGPDGAKERSSPQPGANTAERQTGEATRPT